jgi:hypothetical protein
MASNQPCINIFQLQQWHCLRNPPLITLAILKGLGCADWGLSANSSTTLDHIVQSALNSTSPPLVLYAADYSYAGVHCLSYLQSMHSHTNSRLHHMPDMLSSMRFSQRILCQFQIPAQEDVLVTVNMVDAKNRAKENRLQGISVESCMHSVYVLSCS